MRKRAYYTPYAGQRRKPWLWLLGILLGLAVLAFTALQIYIGSHARTYLTGEPEVMVIFGCRVMSWGPSILLQDRLDTALDYLADHPDMTVVVTGGKGDDEHKSEAQAMYDYLTENGVDGADILMEDRSHSTWENVNYTLALLEEQGIETSGNIVAVSSGFHLSRIEMLWNRAGGGDLTSVLAAPVTHKPSAVQMFFREPLALVKSYFVDR